MNTPRGKRLLILAAFVAVGFASCRCFRREPAAAPPKPPDYGLSFRFEAPLCFYEHAQGPQVPAPQGYHWYSWPSRAGGDLVNHILVNDTPCALVGYIKHLCVDGSRLGGYRVWVCFGQDGRPVLEAETAGNITRRLVIMKDGEIVMAPVVRREIGSCDAIIGFDFSAHEATWLAGALHSEARTQCSECPVMSHGHGHTTCHMACGHSGHAGACPYHSCTNCGTGHCSCAATCTHKAHDHDTCPHVMRQSCPVCARSTSYCTGHFACQHGCGSSCHHAGSCATCTVAPPLGKELKASAPSSK